MALVECGCGEDTWQLGIGGRMDLPKRGGHETESWSGRFKGTSEEGSEKAPERVMVWINLNAAVTYEGLGSVKHRKLI